MNMRLRLARTAKQLSQKALAELVGKHEVDISKYETGRSAPDAETKQKIAEALGHRPIELF